MDIITPTRGQLQRRVAHRLVKMEDPSLFNALYNDTTGLSVTMGNFLMTLVLLGLYKRKDFQKMKNYYVGRGDL